MRGYLRATYEINFNSASDDEEEESHILERLLKLESCKHKIH